MTMLVEAERYDQLFRVDQLLREREAGRVFLGWAEGKYNFRPTFKVERRRGVVYNPQRSPAWCDRVLWKSIAGFPCRQLTLGSCEAISTSDHKPIVSCFEIDTFLYPAAVDKERGTCTMSFQFLRCSELKVYTEGVVKKDGKKQVQHSPCAFLWSPSHFMYRHCLCVVNWLNSYYLILSSKSLLHSYHQR
jgi:hypothetical protein